MQPVNLLEEEWEFLTEFLPNDWREQARKTGALRRARGIADADCLLRLILMHTATGLSLRQTVVRAREQSIADIFDVALLKRLRSSEPWLRGLTSRMTALGEDEIVQRLCSQRRVRVVDATTIHEQGGAGTDWRVHYTMGLPDLNCDFFELTDEHGGETYRRIPVERLDLLLADRGYSNAAGISAVREAEGDVLVRWQIELRFKHLKSLPGLGCLPKYDDQSCRAWIQAKLLCGLLIERLMREAKFFPPEDIDCLPPSHWREFIEARDAVISVISRPLRPRQLVARGAAIRSELRERGRTRTSQLSRYPWERFSACRRRRAAPRRCRLVWSHGEALRGRDKLRLQLVRGLDVLLCKPCRCGDWQRKRLGVLWQTCVFNTTPNGQQGAVWMSGSGPAANESGNLYFATGNGTFDATDYGDSLVKLSGNLSVLDYFCPSNQAALNNCRSR